MIQLNELAWHILAFIASRKPIADYLIKRAALTPYFDLLGYMDRDWLFNGYSSDLSLPEGERGKSKRFPRLPSIRVHHILRADLAAHPHDHPWPGRTIILRDWYIEKREGSPPRVLRRGDTAAIAFGEFHHIERVSDGGVWTIFITWDYVAGWGFLVDGAKVPWRQYVDAHPERSAGVA